MTEEQNRNIPLPKPPADYIFDQADSPENILFEQFAGPSSLGGAGGRTIVDLEDQDALSAETIDALSIKAASLVKLVERLTHHLYLHPKLSSTFLMFFREFCTARELLALLAKRYDVPDLTSERIAQLNYNFDKLVNSDVFKFNKILLVIKQIVLFVN